MRLLLVIFDRAMAYILDQVEVLDFEPLLEDPQAPILRP
jgi:hypothetical protein